ncbi:MAG: hypothetical protein MUC92_04925 [Fimbriimonadaceae bacterium]|jgi:hypothetical protein|nr:hypothetical protein [Fimbriimonadaceae bacterium]
MFCKIPQFQAKRILAGLCLLGLALGLSGCRPEESSEVSLLRELAKGIDPKAPTVSVVVLSSRQVETNTGLIQSALREAGFDGAPLHHIKMRQWLVLLDDTLCMIVAHPQAYFTVDNPAGNSREGTDLARKHKGAWMVDVLRVVGQDGKDRDKELGFAKAGKLAAFLADDHAIGLYSPHQDRLLAASPTIWEQLKNSQSEAAFLGGVPRGSTP